MFTFLFDQPLWLIGSVLVLAMCAFALVGLRLVRAFVLPPALAALAGAPCPGQWPPGGPWCPLHD